MSGSPAGFWRRYAAWTLDAAIIAVPALLLSWPTIAAATADFAAAFARLAAAMSALLLDAVQSSAPPLLLARQWLASEALRVPVEALSAALSSLLLAPLAAFVAMSLLYHVVFERSGGQATPGQRAVGLHVVDNSGRALTAGHALLRFASGTLSWLTLNIGHLLAAVPPEHLALHDRVSATRVRFQGDSQRLPTWARAWIGLQALAFVALNAWLLHAALRAMERAFAIAL
ncbi:RDD family protein [Luteimonas vadosa]|uniref:RDD domain-containing protein n=1 Tax=Luteimonas vadosa TaxID=1165507 RepID=A0ABP9DRA1_9GAMM